MTTNHHVEDFVNKYHGNCNFWILFGSFSRNEEKNDSDIDLIVVYDSVKNPSYEKTHYAGWPVDVYIFDMSSLKVALDRALSNGRLALANAIIEGLVFPNASVSYQEIRSHALKVRSQYTFNNTEGSRFYITELISNLKRNNLGAEKNILAAELYRALITILLKKRGEGVCTGKHAIKILQRDIPEMFALLDSAFKLAIADTPNFLIDAAGTILSSIGGPLSSGYSLNLNYRLPSAIMEHLPPQ